jgi:hypothetical protein
MLKKIIVPIVLVLVSSGFVFAETFTGPTQNAPFGNTAAPVNDSFAAQVKGGGLSLGSLIVNGGSYFVGNVGIGISPTSNKLEVAGNIETSGWVGRTAHSVGGLLGSYNNIGANSSRTNPIYVIGSSYKPADTTLENMYGIGYTHSNASFDNGSG